MTPPWIVGWIVGLIVAVWTVAVGMLILDLYFGRKR